MTTPAPQIVEHATVIPFEEEAIVYDRSTDRAYHFNGVASLILGQCDGRHDIADIETEVVRQYDADGDVVRADVERTLDRLVELGLVE